MSSVSSPLVPQKKRELCSWRDFGIVVLEPRWLLSFKVDTSYCCMDLHIYIYFIKIILEIITESLKISKFTLKLSERNKNIIKCDEIITMNETCLEIFSSVRSLFLF